MSREILFKGKRVDNNQWTEGFLSFIYTDGRNSNGFIYTDKAQIYSPVEVRSHDVYTSTVGQFTGLCDKNGKKIFEGDILYKEGHWTFYVGYEMGAFRAIPLEPVQKLNWPHCTLEEFLRVGMGDCKGFKVIGNIHDNPELVKEVTE